MLRLQKQYKMSQVPHNCFATHPQKVSFKIAVFPKVASIYILDDQNDLHGERCGECECAQRWLTQGSGNTRTAKTANDGPLWIFSTASPASQLFSDTSSF